MKALFAIIVAALASFGTRAQTLSILSTRFLAGEGVELQLSSANSGTIAVDASADLRSWTEITNSIPDAAAKLRLFGSAANARFFRVVTGDAYFTAVIRSSAGLTLTNATLLVETTGQSFAATALGEVKIPTRLLPFSSGFRVRVSAPDFGDVVVNLSPYTYFYSFGLARAGPVPGFAPATLQAIEVLTGPGGGIGAGTRYTVILTGGASGTFRAAFPEGDWVGTFTYTPMGNTARLYLALGSFAAGDYDDMILRFDVNSDAHTFTGTQSVSSAIYPFTGRFWLR